MIDHEVSSLYVKPLEPGGDTGIITERDILRRFRQDGEEAFSKRVSDIAVFPLASLPADAFVYRAIARMKRMHVRHLGVHDHHGEVVGALALVYFSSALKPNEAIEKYLQPLNGVGLKIGEELLNASSQELEPAGQEARQ